MKIEIEVPNFAAIVTEKMNEALAPEALGELIKKNCDKIVEDFLDDSFSTYRGKGEEIKKALAENFAFDSKKIAVPGYEDIILNSFAKAFAGVEEKEIAAKADSLVKSLVKQAPKEIELKEIVDMYCDWLEDSHLGDLEDYYNETDDGTVRHVLNIYEDNEDSMFHDIKISVEGLEKYELKLHVYSYRDNPKILSYYTLGREFYHNVDIADWDDMRELEQMLFKMKSSRTEIVENESMPEYLEREFEN